METTPANATPRTRAAFADSRDLDLYLETLQRFERGELDAEAWRAFRLVHGTYGQRQDGDAHMQRVKAPQGILEAAQLNALADVAALYSRGFGHISTRQNIQLHFVKLSDTPAALTRLAEVGLTTREACGNSVRNITACPYAGVARDERFDVTPYSEATTRYFLRHPLSSSLPRKFKIAFEGCPEDHVGARINDIGFRAEVRSGEAGAVERGFRVTVGGGTASLCRLGQVLFDFLPVGELLNVAEAILRTFHRLGDRQNRNANRLKFLIRKLGWEGFHAEVARELEQFRAQGGARLPFDPAHPPVEQPPAHTRPAPLSPESIQAAVTASVLRGPGLLPVLEVDSAPTEASFQAWQRSNVRPQAQAGWAVVAVTVPLGDLSAAQFRVLADLALAYGDGAVRVTTEQNVFFRWIREQDVRPLHQRLASAGLGRDGAGTISDVVSCPGAETCKLAVTQSRGLGRLLGDFLRSRPDLTEAASDLQIKMSGCPNGCSQHHIAGIGFQGSARKLSGRAVPQYFVLLGGTLREEGAQFGRLAAKIPARRVPEALERLIGLYRAERRAGESATEFFARVELPAAKKALAGLDALTAEQAQPEDYVDLGQQSEFRPETQDGECAS